MPTVNHLYNEPLASEFNRLILCCYINSSTDIQIMRITNIAPCYWERVVFPGQRLMFKAAAEARLEIYTGNGNGLREILTTVIPCQQLCVKEI